MVAEAGSIAAVEAAFTGAAAASEADLAVVDSTEASVAFVEAMQAMVGASAEMAGDTGDMAGPIIPTSVLALGSHPGGIGLGHITVTSVTRTIHTGATILTGPIRAIRTHTIRIPMAHMLMVHPPMVPRPTVRIPTALQPTDLRPTTPLLMPVQATALT